MGLRMLLGWLTLCLASLVAVGRAAVRAERTVFQFGDFTIEASPSDEAYVEALALRLAEFKLPPPPVPVALRLSLADLERRKGHFLKRLAAYLDLPQPTETMAATYDSTLKTWRTMALLAPTGVPRRFAVWRRAELLARIEAGEKIPEFSRDSAGGLDFNFKFERALAPGADDPAGQDVSAQLSAAWRGLVWPMKIDEGTGRSPDDDAARALSELRQFYLSWTSRLLADTRRAEVFNVLHDTVESGVVWQYLTSKDRRWFCDGVANFVSYKVLEEDLGAAGARSYYDLESDLKKFAPLAPRLDLAAWPAAEDQASMKYPADLNEANDAFATKVIADLCARHGDDFLPKLFKEIGRTRREKATIETVFKAYRKLTREDLHSYLSKSPAKG